MLISDAIARMIEEMLNEAEGSLELRRNDLAERVGCVPSQINYVITSRFTPERGYVVESRRGGGGYIRITRKQMDRDEYLMHFFCAIGQALDAASARAFIGNLKANELVTEREARIMNGALGAVPEDEVRAAVMRQIILAIMR